MRSNGLGGAVVLSALLSGCAWFYDPMNTQTLTPDYAVGGGSLQWGDQIIVAAKVSEQDGRVAICGLWTVANESTISIGVHEYFVGSGIIRVNGSTVAQNLDFLPRKGFSENMLGQATGCALTGQSWQSAYDGAKTEIIFPRQDLGAGEMEDTKYRFRQTEVIDITGQTR